MLTVGGNHIVLGGVGGGDGSGDVVGPESSADNAIARFDGTTGKLVQNSNVTISDDGNITTKGVVNQLNGELRVAKFSGRNKTFLLFSYPLAYGSYTTAEAIEFKIHDSHDYAVYSRMEVFINWDGTGISNEVGLSVRSYKVRIKTYSDGTTVSVYAVTDTYCDLFLLSVVYNRINTPFSGAEVGTDAYIPAGSLVFDSTSASNLWHYGTPSHPKTFSVGGGALLVNGELKDNTGSTGTDGQVLKKVGGLVLWSNP